MPALMDAIRKENLKVCDATGLHQLREKLRAHQTSAVRTRSAAAERLVSIIPACPRGIPFHLSQHLQSLVYVQGAPILSFFLSFVLIEHILAVQAFPFLHIKIVSPSLS